MDRVINGRMIDTETLSLSDNAQIWEVACVDFQIHINEDGAVAEVGEALHALVDYRGFDARNLHQSEATLSWTNRTRAEDPLWDYWRQTQIEGRQLPPPAGVSVMTPDQLYDELGGRAAEWVPVWFRNSSFDVRRLDHLFCEAGYRCVPWHRRQQSDLYTVINLAKQLHGYEDNRPAVAEHCARLDAVAQIEQLADVMTALRLGVSEPAPDYAM
ncbi:3'-5' exoribonuclease domain-containing protein [Leisingera caerulea]|uniref:3'-5' exoribonuclease domain-containing protein n=1 Tax=Leisingera caerulea TaxID=506591 RepID=UPI00040994D3|nr:3'-5' exoribonuclease [Leisingera caerulea]